MKIILFLGSGVSRRSNLPGVHDIKARLLHIPGQPKVRKFLQLLESLDSKYLEYSAPYKASPGTYRYTGQIYRKETTYEDLFYLASQITLNGYGLLDDVTTEAFAELVRKKGRRFLKGRTKIERAVDLDILAAKAARFIEQTVADLLHTTTIAGLDLVTEMAQSNRIEQLNIVTLNHDTLIEQALSNSEVYYVDGFGDRDGDVRWFCDQFSDSARVRLIKLHGSINWYRSGDIKIAQPTIISNRDCAEWKDASGERLDSISSTPSFLTGVSKVVSYNRGIFADMHYQFQQVLRECKLIIMSGYGWGDTAINFHLEYWLDRNKSHKLILLHEKPSDLQSRSKELAQMYDAYTLSKRIVSIKKWLEHTLLSELEEYLDA